MVYFYVGLIIGVIVGGIFTDPLAKYLEKKAKELANKRGN